MDLPPESSMAAVKFWRCVRAIPRVWLTRFIEPVFNSGQILAFVASCFGLYLVLRAGANDVERDALSSQWALAIEAFGWALTAWAFISLICAPFIVVRTERQLGRFYGRRFVYLKPFLAATIRCKATGQPQFHKFKFAHAEPASFVHFRIEVEGNPPPHLYSAALTSSEALVLSSSLVPGRGAGQGGLRIGKDSSAELLITMAPDAVSMTVRVYALDFSVGNQVDDTDGNEGEFRGAFRQPSQSHDGRRIA